MILKKPYAFLIRFFGLIHIICMLVITYNAYNFQKIVNFFSNYKSTTSVLPVKNYISFIYIISCIVLIIYFILVFLLMRKKDKPSNYYLLGIIYYSILIIATIYAYNTIGDLIEITIDQKTSRALRDIYLIISLPNYYFLIMSFVRGLGFDIKKFNFNKDLNELKIQAEDNEEFEFVIGNNSFIIKRKIRRHLREFKYYVLENKYIISIIFGVISGIVLISLIINREVVNKIYSLGDTISTNNYIIKLKNAYTTSKDVYGKVIKNDKNYVIIKLDIKANKSNITVKPEHMYLSLGNTKISSYKTTLADSFSDIGITYQNNKLSSNFQEYIFIFEIDKKNISSKYTLNIFNNVSYNKKNQQVYNYEIAKIKPQKIDKTLLEKTFDYNETINIDNNIYGNSNLNILKSQITNKYEYSYENCNNNVCSMYTDIELPNNNNKLLILEYNLNIDKNTTITNQILNKIIKLKYKINENYQETPVAIRTNPNIKNILFIEIPNYIVNSDEIFINIQTRLQKNLIKIK